MRARPGAWLVAIALVGSVAAPLWLGGLPALDGLAHLSAGAIALVLVPTLLSWIARAAKLRLLTRRLGLVLPLARVAGISLATDFAFVTTPGGVGGYAANILLLRKSGASSSQATAIAAADQIVDAAFFAFALPLAAMFALGSAASPALLRIAFVSAGLLLAGALVALCLRRPFARLLGQSIAALAARFARVATLRDLLVRSAQETTRLLQGDQSYAIALAACTSVQWIARYGILWVVLAVLGHSVPWAVVLLAQALVMHAAQWSGVPAGVGAAELGLAAALTPWVSSSAFAPAAIVWRVASLHLAVLAGGIALLLVLREPRRTPSMLPAQKSVATSA